MTVFFSLILEILGEIILQIAFQALAGAGLHLFERTPPAVPQSPWLLAFGYVCLGLAVGSVSLLFFPHPLLHSKTLLVANLILTPVLSGAAMALIGMLRTRLGKPVITIDRFSYGFVFALAMAAVRFLVLSAWCLVLED